MNSATLGWLLAVAAVAAGQILYGWRGVVLALSVVVFWLLLQFSRALRAMRQAGRAPVGRVPSAVMLHARLQRGQRLVDVIGLAGSLGQRRTEPAEQPERWAWADDSGAEVVAELHAGKLERWTLVRTDAATAPADPG